MKLQTDKNLNPIREWGCYFMSIVAMDELASGQDMSYKQVIDLWFKNYREGDIDIESTIRNPQGLLDDMNGNLKFLGKYDRNYQTAGDEFEILKFYNPSTGIEHFVLGDGKGKCKFDPFANSNTVAKGYVESKRIFKRKG